MNPTQQLPLAAVVTHQVEDFTKWKPYFDAHQGARQEAGIYAHCLNRFMPNDDTICAYFLAKDRDKLEAFFAAPGLASAMKEAGVNGPPSISFVRQVEDKTRWDRPLAAAIVIHDVADYESWKQAFDEHAAERQRAGITAYAVNRNEEQPNQIVAFLQAEDEKMLHTFFEAPELQQAMQAAGVLNPPNVMFLQSLERVDY